MILRFWQRLRLSLLNWMIYDVSFHNLRFLNIALQVNCFWNQLQFHNGNMLYIFSLEHQNCLVLHNVNFIFCEVINLINSWWNKRLAMRTVLIMKTKHKLHYQEQPVVGVLQKHYSENFPKIPLKISTIELSLCFCKTCFLFQMFSRKPCKMF